MSDEIPEGATRTEYIHQIANGSYAEILRVTADGTWLRGGDHKPLIKLTASELIQIIKELAGMTGRMSEDHRAAQKRLYDEMVDEIKRLRAQVISWCHTKELDEAEIERLRVQCKELAQSTMNNGQQLLLYEAALRSVRFLAEQTKPTENATWEDYAKTCLRIIADEARDALGKK